MIPHKVLNYTLFFAYVLVSNQFLLAEEVSMKIQSPAFADNQKIPSKYTCEGKNISPPLEFSDLPPSTKSIALIVEDPDAPSGTFDHWIVWNLPPSTTHLSEGAAVPFQGRNHYGKAQYNGPCPPPGKPHRYFFKAYALDTLLNLSQGIAKADLEEAMKGHIITKSELVGLYAR
jgi:hypothetical protein